MTKTLTFLIAATLSTAAMAKPPIPSSIANSSISSKKEVCDEAASFAETVFVIRDVVSSDFIENRISQFKDEPVLHYIMGVSLYAGYNARSKEAAYNEAWGACYRYIRFQE